jgi:RNase P subunit RPR2
MQVYEIIEEDLLNKWDSLSKEQIKEVLKKLLPERCKNCNKRADRVLKRGSMINSSWRDAEASTWYDVCDNCNHIYRYTFM